MKKIILLIIIFIGNALSLSSQIIIRLIFYGNEFNIKSEASFKNIKLTPNTYPSFVNIKSLWKKFHKEKYSDIKQSITNIAEELNLNDYGLYLLISEFSRALLPNKSDEQIIFTVSLLNQLGYNARIGDIGHKLVCLIPCRQNIHFRAKVNFDGFEYYIFQSDPSAINNHNSSTYIYRDLSSENSKIIDLNINSPIKLANNPTTHQLLDTTITINKNIIEFYYQYPQTDKDVYANATFDDNIKELFYDVFSKEIEGLSEYESVKYLLKYVHSLDYKTDEEQFGFEKTMFFEESLYYPESDCEDRSIYFTKLIKIFLDLDVIILEYNDHVTTAIKFSEDIDGDYIIYGNEKYYICDPSYLNSRPGQSMPKYLNQCYKIYKTK